MLREVSRILAFFLVFQMCAMALKAQDQIEGGFRFVSPASEKKERWRVEGDQALFLDKDVIEISPVTATIGNPLDQPMMIMSPWARFDRKSKNVWTDSNVEITKGRSKLTGIGLRWKPALQKITILKDVVMVVDLKEVKGMKEL